MLNKKSEKYRLYLVKKARDSQLVNINPDSIKIKIVYKIEDYDINYQDILKSALESNIQRLFIDIVRELNIFKFKIVVFNSEITLINKKRVPLFEVFAHGSQNVSLGFLSISPPEQRKHEFHSLFEPSQIDSFVKSLPFISSEQLYLYAFHLESAIGTLKFNDYRQAPKQLNQLRKVCYEFMDKVEKECDFYCEKEISYIEYVCLIGKETDFYIRFSKKIEKSPKSNLKIRKFKDISEINIIQSLSESGVIPCDIATNEDLLNTELKELFSIIKLLDY